jgi:hypothetical protein
MSPLVAARMQRNLGMDAGSLLPTVSRPPGRYAVGLQSTMQAAALLPGT